MASYRKINIASENDINYRVTSQSNHFCQISIVDRERLGISVMIQFFSVFKAKTCSCPNHFINTEKH